LFFPAKKKKKKKKKRNLFIFIQAIDHFRKETREQ
jgi:hypothetical protein